jgi:hypothetical protein
MKRILLVWATTLLIVSGARAEEPVHFADPGLQAAVEEALWLPDPTPSDMLDLTYLDASHRLISNLTGLEYATNLRKLNVKGNNIYGISVVAGMTELEELVVNNNHIGDLSPVAGLTKLKNLDVHDQHAVTSVSPLAGLVNLERLVLRGNLISDITPLAGLTKLRSLYLEDNHISDIAPLLDLPPLELLNLEDNPLNEDACTTYIPLLWARNPGMSLRHNSCGTCRLVLSSTAGGAIIRPGEGEYLYRSGEIVWLEAKADPCFVFDTWSGSILGRENPICITMFSDLQISADFRNVNDPQNPGGPHIRWKLTLSATPGGSVIQPGQGQFTYDDETHVRLEARPDPGYVFAGWSGTYPTLQNPVLAVMNQDHRIQANFVSEPNVLYVDDNGPHDPKSGNSAWSDPKEDGSVEHPFDCIQEAIQAADEEAFIVVRPGTYRENIHSLHKNLHLTGENPADPHGGPCAVIEAAGAGPVVQLSGVDTKSTLTGLVIMGGRDQTAGAILCRRTTATLTNCLIVGNRSTDPNGAAVHATSSTLFVTNCTIADNNGGQRSAGITLVNSDLTMLNSILWNNTSDQVLTLGMSRPDIHYSAVRGWWAALGNIYADPLFAQPGGWIDAKNPAKTLDPGEAQAIWKDGDYHLKSQAGRWDPLAQTWVQDEVTSPCIDRGDRASPVGSEPAPNGGIIDMGAYGGTSEASASPLPVSSGQ